MTLSTLSELERQVLQGIVEDNAAQGRALADQIQLAEATQRENTGGGYTTELRVPEHAKRMNSDGPLHLDRLVEVDGLTFGLGFILFVKEGRVRTLEGYSFEENTHEVDLGNATFRIRRDRHLR